MATSTTTSEALNPIVSLAFEKAVDYVTHRSDIPSTDSAVHLRECGEDFLDILLRLQQSHGELAGRDALAAIWGTEKDPKEAEREVFTGTSLGFTYYKTQQGGNVFRVAVWVPAFDKNKDCATVEEARNLWEEYDRVEGAAGENGVLYNNGIKAMRLAFGSDGFPLDRPGSIRDAAHRLFGQPVRAFREMSVWSDGKRKVGVCHRMVEDLDRLGDIGNDDPQAAQEPPASKRPRSKRTSTRSTAKQVQTEAPEVDEAPAPRSRRVEEEAPPLEESSSGGGEISTRA